MNWLDKELASVWWKDSTTRIDAKARYALFLDIKSHWDGLSNSLRQFEKEKFHKFYAGNLIHDGNRACSLIESYIRNYENGGDWLTKEGWHTAQGMLEYCRQAEVLIELYDALKEKHG